MPDTITLTLDEAYALSIEVLTACGLTPDHAHAVTRVIIAGQRDECHSHGLYRLIDCARSLRDGKAIPDAVPVIEDVSPALVRVDAGFGLSPLAFEVGSKVLLSKAKTTGIAALVINNCFHFSALWPEVESLAHEGVAALAMNPTFSTVAPAGGTRPLFGTNPFAFAWPRPGPHPYVFDFATSVIARGDIELHKRLGKKIPMDWAVDEHGKPTDNAEEALRGAMLTFGGYKGSALSTMIELLAGPLLGDLTSAESRTFDEGVGATPCHGELIVAFNPALFSKGDAEQDSQRAEKLFESIKAQGGRLPSERRFEARARSIAHGVTIPVKIYNEIIALK